MRLLTQSSEERRLRRVAAAYNKDARALGQRYQIQWHELLTIEEAFPFCAYCNIELEIGQGTFDHAIPLDRNGPNLYHNLVRCCYTCQREKGTKTPEEYAFYKTLWVTCPVDGVVFKPRWNEWQAGRARLCSRRCAAFWRWQKEAS